MKINKNEDYNKRGEKKMVISLGEILTLSRMWKVKYIVSKNIVSMKMTIQRCIQRNCHRVNTKIKMKYECY